MNIFIAITIAVVVVAISLNLVLIRRNRKLFMYQMHLLAQVKVAATDDIKCLFLGKDYNWSWRYDALDEPGYNKMLLRFWKPLPSFYKNFDFIDPSVKRENTYE